MKDITIKYKGLIPYVADAFSIRFDKKSTLITDYSEETVVNENGKTEFKEPKYYSYGYLTNRVALGEKRGWVLNLPKKGMSIELEYHPQKFEEINDLYWVFEGRVFPFPENAIVQTKKLTDKNQEFVSEHNLNLSFFGHGKKNYISFDGNNASIDTQYDTSIQKSPKYYVIYFGDDRDGLYEKGMITHSLPNAYLYARRFDTNQALVVVIENGKATSEDVIYPFSDNLQEMASKWLQEYYGIEKMEIGGSIISGIDGFGNDILNFIMGQ